MNKRVIVTLFIIMTVSLLACTPKSIEPTQPLPLIRPAQSPTKELPAQPTTTRSAAVKLTKTDLSPLPATPEGSGFQPEMYYTEELEVDADTVNYYLYYMLSGSVDSVEIEDIDDTLWFTFSQRRTSIIYLYDAYEYEEVNITAWCTSPTIQKAPSS